MGCIQSKPKGKDLPQGANDVTQTGGNKAAHIRYDDPPPSVNETQGQGQSGTTNREVKDESPVEVGIKKHRDEPETRADDAVQSLQQEANKSKVINDTEMVQMREKTGSGESDGNQLGNQLKNDTTQINRETITLSSKSDATDGLVRPEVMSRQDEVNSNQDRTVDIADISLGQGVAEIEMARGQTIQMDGDDNSEDREPNQDTVLRHKTTVSTNSSETPPSSATKTGKKNTQENGDNFGAAMKIVHDPGSPNILYQNRESLEPDIPAGLPKPAPPSVKKKDLIKPNQFTIVDKIVDQAPNDGFQSVPKLGQYLSGKVKKGEMETEEDEDMGMFKNLPPPVPTQNKRKDLFKDVSVFKRVDDNAKNTPENVKTSIPKLATHLCSVAKKDIEKVRAFYYWICNNIRYLYDKDSTIPDRMKFDAGTTLRQGQGSFVSVFVALCKEANIPALTIMGCSKGLLHQPDRSFHIAERNHCWNAAYIDGEWRFIDCTWGSGHMDANRKFHQKFDEFWFLTDPEVFVYDHFPSHPIWQLLEDPVDIDEFNTKPCITDTSRKVGLQLLSHREPIVYVQDEVTLQFSTEEIPLSNMTADFRTISGTELNKHRCIRRLDPKVFEVRVVPPEEGEYNLIIYGKSKDYLHAKFRKLMEYTLRCDHVYLESVTFPNHLKAWGPEPNYAKFGFADDIQSMSVFTSDSNEMTIALKQTRNTVVSVELKATDEQETALNDHIMITAGVNLQKDVHVRFPHKGYFRLEVYAEGDLDKYEYVAAFLLNCTESMEGKATVFPKYNVDAICKHECALLSPLQRELPADTSMTFRLRSTGLKSAMLGVPMEADYGSRLKRLGELTKTNDIFEGTFQTPKKGETMMLSGCAAPPNVFWARTYEFVVV